VLDELIEEVGEIEPCLENLIDQFKGEGESYFGKGVIKSKEEILGDKSKADLTSVAVIF